jgi:hypothetical protein
LDSSGADRGVVSLEVMTMSPPHHRPAPPVPDGEPEVDPREPVMLLQRDLRTGPNGLSDRAAARRLEVVGPNLAQRAAVRRGGVATSVPTSELVPGDVLLIEEGERIPADARLLRGAVEVDTSALTGESVPVERSAEAIDTADRRLDSPVLVFSGTSCVAGSAVAVVHATGRHTEIGRIAALSGRVGPGASPLERQVRRVAWLIAAVAVGAAAAFLPLGLLAGLTLTEAFLFAIGLLVANVPEGLLPTITLALATRPSWPCWRTPTGSASRCPRPGATASGCSCSPSTRSGAGWAPPTSSTARCSCTSRALRGGAAALRRAGRRAPRGRAGRGE